MKPILSTIPFPFAYKEQVRMIAHPMEIPISEHYAEFGAHAELLSMLMWRADTIGDSFLGNDGDIVAALKVLKAEELDRYAVCVETRKGEYGQMYPIPRTDSLGPSYDQLLLIIHRAKRAQAHQKELQSVVGEQRKKIEDAADVL